MSLTRTRAAVATGLTLGTATAGLFLAPAAFAAPVAGNLAAPAAPTTVVAGAPFTVSGAGCTTDDPTDPVAVELYTEYVSDDEYFIPAADGSWSVQTAFYADTKPGTYMVWAACVSYNGVESFEDFNDYPTLEITVTAPTTTTPAPPAATPPVAFKPGAKANTPGIAATSSTATSNVAAPGQKITKVLKGFKPGEKVTLVMHSTPVELGTFTADAKGVVTATFTLPAGTALGTHTLAYDGDMGSHFEETLTLTADGKALAYTGADIAMPLIGGTVMVAAGAAALVVTRRRRTAEAVQA